MHTMWPQLMMSQHSTVQRYENEFGGLGYSVETLVSARHTFCFFVRHPLQAPLIRDGIVKTKMMLEGVEQIPEKKR